MKKAVMFLTLLLLTVASVSAQEIFGNWKRTEVEKGAKFTMFLNFVDETNVRFRAKGEIDEPEVGNITVTFTLKGTYAKKKKVLTFNYDKTSAKVTLDDIKFSGALAEAVKDNSELAKTVKKMAASGLDDLKNKMVDELNAHGTYNILSLTPTELKISDENGEIEQYTRVGQ